MAQKDEDLTPTPTQAELNAIATGKPIKAKGEQDKAEEKPEAAKKTAAAYSNRQAKAD